MRLVHVYKKVFVEPSPSVEVEVFVCDVLSGVRVTRNACASRHRLGNPNAETSPKWGTPNTNRACGVCELGRQHLKGEQPRAWPNGNALVTIRLKPATKVFSRQDRS